MPEDPHTRLTEEPGKKQHKAGEQYQPERRVNQGAGRSRPDRRKRGEGRTNTEVHEPAERGRPGPESPYD